MEAEQSHKMKISAQTLEQSDSVKLRSLGADAGPISLLSMYIIETPKGLISQSPFHYIHHLEMDQPNIQTLNIYSYKSPSLQVRPVRVSSRAIS